MSRRISIFFFFISALFFLSSGLHAAERVRIMEPSLYAPDNLAFLKKGIQQLLANRVEAAGELASRPEAASFELRSSLTAFGGTLVTDFTLARISSGESVLFKRYTTQKQEEILDQINTFGEEVVAFLAKEPASATPAPMAAQTATTPFYAQPAVPPQYQIPVAQAPTHTVQGYQIVNTGRVEEDKLISMDIGDLQGSGSAELALAFSREVRVLDLKMERLLAKLSLAQYEEVIRMDVLDTDKNGKAEIWLTVVNTNSQKLRSRVLELSGTGLNTLAGPENRFFAKARNQRGEAIMLSRMRGFKMEVFSGDIQEAKISGKKIALSKTDIAYTDLFGDIPVRIRDAKTMDVFKISDAGHLSLFDAADNLLWKSENAYAGLPIALTHDTADGDKYDRTARYYLHAKCIALDHGNGKESLIVADNEESIGRLFQRVRMFKTGSLHAMTWNGYTVDIAQLSPELQGYIADFVLLPGNPGAPAQVLLGLVKGGGDLSLSSKTQFLVLTVPR